MVVEVFAATGGGGGGGVEDFGFSIGLAAHHPRPDDARQRVRPGHDPFGLTAAGQRGCPRRVLWPPALSLWVVRRQRRRRGIFVAA